MAKRLSAQIKKEILDLFVKSGFNIEKLANKFECTTATITRNLKKELGNQNYQEIIDSRNPKTNPEVSNINTKSLPNQDNLKNFNVVEPQLEFVELAPLEYEIENTPRKELTSIPIGEIEFPKIVYMIVDKNIELEIKFLKDYPNWEFLPNEDLNRKTIEIFFELKTAKRACIKEQKVIKVPNTNVFKIVSPILISRGISRIVSEDKLIAL